MTSHQLDRMARRVAELLAVHIRAIIKQEIKPMVDAVADLTSATDAALAFVASLLGEIEKDLVALAAMPKDNTPALEQQIDRLRNGTSAAQDALKKLQTPAAAAPADAPAASAPADGAPAAEPASVDPAAPAQGA